MKSINSVKDLQSLVRFLHITGGIEQPEIFNTKITRRLASGEPDAEVILQALMRDICLRRKKDMKFVDLRLPEKKEYIHRITFHPNEKIKYQTLLQVPTPLLYTPFQHFTNKSTGLKPRGFWRLIRVALPMVPTINSDMFWRGFYACAKRKFIPLAPLTHSLPNKPRQANMAFI